MCVCVIDQSVAGTFPHFVLPGGRGSLVATHTAKIAGNRAIRRQARFVDGSTNKSVQRTCSREISLSDQLRLGLLGNIGDDTFLLTRTERTSSRSLPCLHFHVTGETVVDLRFVEQSAVQRGTGVWCLLRNLVCSASSQPPTPSRWWAEIGPVAWFRLLPK